MLSESTPATTPTRETYSDEELGWDYMTSGFFSAKRFDSIMTGGIWVYRNEPTEEEPYVYNDPVRVTE